MKSIARTLTLLLILLLSITGAIPAAAQTDSEEDMLAMLDGLEMAHGRFASIDFSNPVEGDESAVWLVLAIYTFTFDSEDAAAAAIEPLTENGVLAGFGMAGEDAQIEETSVDLETPHTAIQAVSEDDGVTWTSMQVMVQDGDRIYMVFGMAGGVDPAVKIATLLNGMLDAEVSTDAEMFNVDGTSTGGVWARFPTIEDIQVDAAGLTDVEDQFFDASAPGTPAA